MNLNCFVFASLKFLGSLPYKTGAAIFFLKNRNGLWYLNPLICVDA
jgi:hypothetical protein